MHPQIPTRYQLLGYLQLFNFGSDNEGDVSVVKDAATAKWVSSKLRPSLTIPVELCLPSLTRVLQAFRHLYVLATEDRCVESVDVDTNQPVFVPLEITVGEGGARAETTYTRVTPCLLPERAHLKRVRVCGPRWVT